MVEEKNTLLQVKCNKLSLDDSKILFKNWNFYDIEKKNLLWLQDIYIDIALPWVIRNAFEIILMM
jgi:hypothetical protein